MSLSITTLAKCLFRRFTKKAIAPRNNKRFRPMLESCEDRVVPVIPNVSVATISDATEDGADGLFRFTRVGNLSGSLTVNVSVSGTATSGTDYTPIGTTVTFAPSVSTANVTVAAIDDVVYDPSETVIVTATSGAGYTVGSPSSATVTIIDDEGVPVYWVGGSGGSWSTAANWSNNAVPTSTTAVYFDSSYSNYSVTTPSGSDLTLGELHFVNGYSGTVTLARNLTVDKLELNSANATLDQPTSLYGTTDVTVDRAMLWAAGTLNSTANLANLYITGGTTWATFAPASAGTIHSGSSINLDSGAVVTMKAGDFEFDNEDAVFNVEAATLIADPGDGQELNIGANNFAGQFNLDMATSVLNIKGTTNTRSAINNTAGTFILRSGVQAAFTGAVDKAADGPSISQSGGSTKLYLGSILTLSDSTQAFLMSGGTLSIMLDTGTGPAEIVGNMKVTGGDIISGANDTGDNHLFGQLQIHGNVHFIGGTYRPFVSADSDDVSDIWYATGTFTIGGTAAIAPGAVDGENNPVLPPSGMAWFAIRSDGGITNAADTPSILSGWAVEADANNPVTWWKVKGA
jgi:hypothetical protein